MKRLDLTQLKAYPLAERESLDGIKDILIEPSATPPEISPANREQVALCAANLRAARESDASVMLIYGAHLVKNGAHKILNELMAGGWLTHLATNGAGIIHDWEWAHHGRSTESVRANVATGTFGTWEETGRYLNLAALTAGIANEGWGQSLGRMVAEDGVTLPELAERENSPAQADLREAMQRHKLAAGRHEVLHPWKATCVLHTTYAEGIPLTVHPGIGYDIISNHPLFNGAAIGRAAQVDFELFGGAVEQLDGGVVLSIGSAIMGPQVFEKSLSCVNNLRLQAGREIMQRHSIHVVDLQDGGDWDWTQGEPPCDNPAYYLRFCKSYARMGGEMHYAQCDNVAFMHHLLNEIKK